MTAGLKDDAAAALRPGVERPVRIIGHSHTLVIGHAPGPPLNSEISALFEKFLVTGEDGKQALHPDVKKSLYEPLFSFTDGSSHLILGHLQHPRPFDIVVPELPHLPLTDGAEIIPLSLVEDALYAWSADNLLGIGLMRQAVGGRMYQVESPPPFFVDNPPDHPIWDDLAGGITEISPPHLRFKLWWVQSRMIRTFCETNGILYVPRPDKTVDENGYLLPEYQGVPAHGNNAYGSAVREQILDLLQ